MTQPATFQKYVKLVRLFLAHREDIVECIDAVLNAQRKPVAWLQDRPLLSRHFEDCFFACSAVTADDRKLKGQLVEAHWAAGFLPRQVQHVYNDLIHPSEMMIRAFHCWQQTQWPGRNGRMHYAHTLFNLYIVRYMALLSMRIWDDDPGSAGGRLAEIQGTLDELWRSSPADQPAFVRDALWLIPLAQSLITDELAPYLEVERQVAESLPEKDALEIHRASVRMLGGHLVSQIRYYCTKNNLSINDPSVVGRTRTSNALDFALLVQGLVDLLRAYERALQSGDERMRCEMAGAILQGMSADPELFLHRVHLLSAYSMMEHVFIGKDAEGRAAYSSPGERHLQLLQEYGALIERLKASLREDAPRFRPAEGRYSPYGVMFGIPSNLIEHMALKALQRDAETQFSLEDVFDDRDSTEGKTGAAKLAWVNGWRNLPHISPEVQRLYDYPQQFAEEIYSRIEHELGRCNSSPEACGRLHIISAGEADFSLPARYFLSSDAQMVTAKRADHCERAELLRKRQEAHFLVSYETSGGWVGLRKDLLTDVLGAGRDAGIAGLPPYAAQVLRLMCPGLMTVPVTG